MAERTYQAFVSYRHAERDTAVATEVQHGLERFVIPKALRKNGSRHIAPVFRDKEELSATPELDSTIETALNNSDVLVVICSPSTGESPWVQREIDLFLATHDRSRVFTVLAEGASGDAIPKSLYYEKEERASSGETVTRSAQPLSCDFRSDKRSDRRDELTRFVAAILEVPYDSLVRRAPRRRSRIVAAISALAMAIVLGIACYTLWSNARIHEQYLDSEMLELSNCTWVAERRNVVLVGASGTGKTWAGCALAAAECNAFHTVRYVRMPEMLDELAASRDEDWLKAKRRYRKCDLLFVDDWLLKPVGPREARELLELVESRYRNGSMIICSQYGPSGWHERIPVSGSRPTLIPPLRISAYCVRARREYPLRPHLATIYSSRPEPVRGHRVKSSTHCRSRRERTP